MTWTSSNLPGTLTLSYSTDGGQTFNAIATGLANSGSTTWNPPGGTTLARLQLKSDSNLATDTQTADFVIGKVWFVDPTASGTPDGTTWATAVARIQTAIDLAATGDSVWVANTGSQTALNVGDRQVVLMQSGVEVIGGFQGDETAPSQRPALLVRTTIDAQSVHQGVIFSEIASVTTVSGFVVKNGTAVSGGGLQANDSSVTLVDCIFDANAASSYGGGAAFFECPVVAITSCSFASNTATLAGGGLYGISHSGSMTLSASQTTFDQNTVTDTSLGSGGGGACFRRNNLAVTLTGCTFSSNTSSRDGGGLYACESSVTIDSSQFATNTAAGNGGGAAFLFGSFAVTDTTFAQNAQSAGGTVDGGGGLFAESIGTSNILRSSFLGNTGVRGGAVLYRGWSFTPNILLLQNCVVANNRATGAYGGGVYTVAHGETDLDFCTFTRNSSQSTGGAYAVDAADAASTITNCILYGDLPDEIGSFDAELNVTVSYSDLTRLFLGTGNISADPLFVSPSTGDFHLSAGSPAIDAANPAGAPTVDRDDLARDTNPDMGAYEHH